MIWMDRRADEETRWVLEHIGEEKLQEITFNGADPYYGYTKILWMKNHEPENWAKTKLFLPPNDYVDLQTDRRDCYRLLFRGKISVVFSI